MLPHDPELGPVSREDLVKGYEFEKGRYVIVEPEELDQIKIESTKTIEIEQLFRCGRVDGGGTFNLGRGFIASLGSRYGANSD